MNREDVLREILNNQQGDWIEDAVALLSVRPENDKSALVKLTYSGEQEYNGSLFYNENTNRIIPIDQPDIYNNTVVIEVSGGVVQAVYAPDPELVKVILVDWDNIEEGDQAGEYSVNALTDMDEDTRDQVSYLL